jgi:hypothetical protein
LASPSYPPAPWHLRGWGIATVGLVDARAALPFVPPDSSVVSVAPGKTVGGLLFLSYESGSTLVYNELNVISALVRVGSRVAFYLPRLYVDSPASLAGGRAIWGVPKLAAAFDVATRGTATAPRGGIPLPLPMPAVGTHDDRFLFFTGRMRARLSRTNATVQLPRDGEFAPLGLDRPLFSVWLDALTLDVPAPTAVMRSH